MEKFPIEAFSSGYLSALCGKANHFPKPAPVWYWLPNVHPKIRYMALPVWDVEVYPFAAYVSLGLGSAFIVAQEPWFGTGQWQTDEHGFVCGELMANNSPQLWFDYDYGYAGSWAEVTSWMPHASDPYALDYIRPIDKNCDGNLDYELPEGAIMLSNHDILGKYGNVLVPKSEFIPVYEWEV